MPGECVFCRIVSRNEVASFVHEDELCVAFLSLIQVRPGETVLIPREHVDHFTDMSEDTAAHIMRVGHRLGRTISKHLNPERIGSVVHGYGVAHAHLILVPQHTTTDITSERFLRVEDGKVSFSPSVLPVVPRKDLDELAGKIRGWIQQDQAV